MSIRPPATPIGKGIFFQILLLSTAAVGLLVLAGTPPATALAEGVVLAMALTLSLGVGTALGHRFLLSTARCLDRGNALLAQLERLHDQLYGFDRVKVEQAVPWLKRVAWNLASGVFVGTVMLLYLFPCGVLLAVLRPPMGLPVGGWVPYALAGGGATLALLLSTHLLRCRHDLRVVANRVVEAEKLQGEGDVPCLGELDGNGRTNHAPPRMEHAIPAHLHEAGTAHPGQSCGPRHARPQRTGSVERGRQAPSPSVPVNKKHKADAKHGTGNWTSNLLGCWP